MHPAADPKSAPYPYNGGYVPRAVPPESDPADPQIATGAGHGPGPAYGAYLPIPHSATSTFPTAESFDLSAVSRPPMGKSESVYSYSRSMVTASRPYASGIVQHTPELLPPALQEEGGFAAAAGRPLRVAHVGPFFLRGGAEQWLLDLIRHADRRSLRFLRCVSTYHEVVDLSYVEALSSLGVTLEAGGAESVRRAAQDADVLLSWGVELDALLGGVRPRLSVQTVHGDGPMNRHFLEHSLGSIDHAVAVSHRVRARVCPGVPTTVIYNGVDTARLAPHAATGRTRRALGFADGDFVVGFVGRFAPEKRPDRIIEAVARLPERFKVLLVGWGRLLPQLQQQASRLLPGRHVITHASGNLGDLYRAMDAVCLASDQEGFPLVMLEAMLCERPLVATAVGAVPEVIEDRVNGLWTTGTPDDLAAVFSRLGRHPRWAAGVAAEGRDTAEQFGFARRMARDYEHLLHHLWRTKGAAAG